MKTRELVKLNPANGIGIKIGQMDAGDSQGHQGSQNKRAGSKQLRENSKGSNKSANLSAGSKASKKSKNVSWSKSKDVVLVGDLPSSKPGLN